MLDFTGSAKSESLHFLASLDIVKPDTSEAQGTSETVLHVPRRLPFVTDEASRWHDAREMMARFGLGH